MIEKKAESMDVVKSELRKQWQEVVKNYPLAAAALLMQNTDFARIAKREIRPGDFDLTSLLVTAEQLASAFGESATVTFVAVRLVNCFRDLYRDMGRARNDAEHKAASEQFGLCIRGEE